MSGPVPKRSSDRLRRNVESRPESVAVVGIVDVPEPDPDWHPIARDWFVSLAASGQSRFYEPSDWQQARIWTEVLSRQLESGRVSAQMMATWHSAAAELLTTEGARRRARMEIERRAVEAAPAPVSSLDDYRDL